MSIIPPTVGNNPAGEDANELSPPLQPYPSTPPPIDPMPPPPPISASITISPTEAVAGSTEIVTLIVTGSHFDAMSVIAMGTGLIVTSVFSAEDVRCEFSPENRSPGVVPVSVWTGGVQSGTADFTFT